MGATLNHDEQIVAVYEDNAAAAHARDALRDAGVPASAINVVDAPAAMPAQESAGDQTLNAFMSLFGSADEHHRYTQTVGAAHAMVVVTPQGDADRNHLIELLDRTHPIDFKSKLEEWRQGAHEGLETPDRSTS